jgi:hypothetical protein
MIAGRNHYSMTRTLRILIVSMGATLLCPLPALSEDLFAEQVDRFRDELRALVDEADSANTRPDRNRIDSLYRSYFTGRPFQERFENHSPDELVALHAATEAAFAYSLSPWLLDHLGHLVTRHAEQLRQDDAGRPNVERASLERFHADLLRARRFSQAQEFAERYELDASPWNVIDETPTGTGPTVLEIDPNRTEVTLTRTTVDLAPGTKIVAVVHPHCGPSRRAMIHIEDDPTLTSLFAGRTVWLADARRMALEPFVDWNAEAREIKIAISYDNHAWPPEIGFMRTPVFYFLRDGVVRDMVIGWPGPKQVERIHAAFDAIGVESAIEPMSR